MINAPIKSTADAPETDKPHVALRRRSRRLNRRRQSLPKWRLPNPVM